MNELPEEKKCFFLGNDFFLFSSVYEPAEDSFLLAEAIEFKKSDVVLDLGCGTGIQGINALMNGAGFVVFSDVNPEALKNTKQNLELIEFPKKQNLELIESDLFSNLKNKKFDVIIFNPPYVVSDEIKYRELDGGIKGREILDKFLNSFTEHLNEKGRICFLQTDLNGLNESIKLLAEKGFNAKVIAKKKLFFEELIVLKAERN
ncbi:MAG: HemK2/MTQ2 family protein methyltransferase [Candidatus Diapherotrites archaeon]